MIATYGQTAIDISIQEYGTIEYIGDIVAANNIELTEVLTGIDLVIPAIDVLLTKQYPIVIKPIPDDPIYIVPEYEQTIIDMAIQEFGSIDYVGLIMKDNDVGLNQNIQSNTLEIDSYNKGNEDIKKYFISNRIKCNNKFDTTVEIHNFVFEDDRNATYEDERNQILE